MLSAVTASRSIPSIEICTSSPRAAKIWSFSNA